MIISGNDNGTASTIGSSTAFANGDLPLPPGAGADGAGNATDTIKPAGVGKKGNHHAIHTLSFYQDNFSDKTLSSLIYSLSLYLSMQSHFIDTFLPFTMFMNR